MNPAGDNTDDEALNREKKDLELRLLRQQVRWEPLSRLIPSFTMLAAIAGGIFGLVQYNDQHAQEMKNQEMEFRRKYWEIRFNAYREITEIAAKIATADTMPLCDKERRQFLIWYWGYLSTIEDEKVRESMVAFEKAMRIVENSDSPNPHDLMSFAYDLDMKCRESLRQTWDPINLTKLDNPLPRTLPARYSDEAKPINMPKAPEGSK